MITVEDIISSGRIRVTCSGCGVRFSGRNKECPKCGSGWGIKEAIGKSNIEDKVEYSAMIRKDGHEALEI